ncbi:MAG: lysine-sensitive aspartokinase 3 [Acidobacteriota bacterium]
MIVMKFGGTSVESAEAIRRIAGIVQSRMDRHPVVVVSAMGKTTNKLLAIAESAAMGIDTVHASLTDLKEFHLEEAAKLGIEDSLNKNPHGIHSTFKELKELVKALLVMGELTPRLIDAISAYGERLSSMIVAGGFRNLGVRALHHGSYIKTDARHTQAAPLFEETYRRLAEAFDPNAHGVQAVIEKYGWTVPVMAGFIASTLEGVTTTLGRGGSDYSASIIGAGIGAEEIQIWTDVDGMLTADPTILPGGHRVKVCSFAEAAELAYFGAKVLHPATVLPAIEKNIPVRILNSRRADSPGTLIVAEPPKSKSPIRSIACKRNITLVNIVSTRMLMAHGFLRRIFEVFDRFETPVDMVATSEVSVSLTIDNTRSLDAIQTQLAEFAEVTIAQDQAIVSLVGDNIRQSPDVSARAFTALKGVAIRMVSQGASQLNLSLVVDAADLRTAVESLHGEFFRDPDPEAFE